MAIVISGTSGIDMGNTPVSNASQIDSTVINENGSNVVSQGELAYNIDTSSYIPNTLSSGAIIERGSNANGQYVKYADGTLICLMSKTLTAGTNAGTTFAFPHVFIDTNYFETFGIISQAGIYINIYSLSGSSRNNSHLMIVRNTGSESTVAQLNVIGRWK